MINSSQLCRPRPRSRARAPDLRERIPHREECWTVEMDRLKRHRDVFPTHVGVAPGRLG